MAKQVKVTDLVADDRNFNKGSEIGKVLIQKSVDKFRAGRSILLDKNNRVIAGNKSLEAFIAAGLTDVQIIESDGNRVIAVKRMDIDLDSVEGRELALADNQTAKTNIIFDAELIEAELGEAICMEWGIDLSGKDDAQEDEFVIPDDVKTSIKVGDLIEIGPHKLLCGDSTIKKTYATLFGDKVADMVLTDPPYNVAYVGKTKKKLTIDNDKQTDNDFYKFLYNFYSAQGEFTKGGGAWYVWHADSEGANFRRAMDEAGLLVKQCLIWVKQTMVMGRQDYQWKHEPCLYGWKPGAAHKWYSDRRQTTVLNFDRPQRSAEHPTMKPVPLFAYQIGNSSKQGDIVADPFGGSGTTMVACHQMNRKAYLIEYDPKYCAVIIMRMLALDPTLIVKVNGKTYKEGGANGKAK